MAVFTIEFDCHQGNKLRSVKAFTRSTTLIIYIWHPMRCFAGPRSQAIFCREGKKQTGMVSGLVHIFCLCMCKIWLGTRLGLRSLPPGALVTPSRTRDKIEKSRTVLEIPGQLESMIICILRNESVRYIALHTSASGAHIDPHSLTVTYG